MEAALYWSTIVPNIVFNAVLCFTALTLNGATIYALRKTPSVPKPLKALLLSLAVSDLGVGILSHPLFITRLALELRLQADLRTSFPTFYRVSLFVAFQFAYPSFFSVLSLSLDRFLAIHLHLRYQELVTYQRVVTAVISIWVLSGLIPLIWLFSIDIAYVLFAIIVVSCFVVSGVLNSMIYATVRRHAHQMHSLQVQPTVQENAPNVSNASTLRKSTFMTIHIYVLFLVCYLPLLCTVGFFRFYPGDAVLKAVKQYTSTLLLLNSSLNPLIYCWKLRGVRRTIMNTLLHAISSQN